MVGWIEIEIEIFLLVILNNFIKAILMHFTITLDWFVYRNYCFRYFMWITILCLPQFETLYVYYNFCII